MPFHDLGRSATHVVPFASVPVAWLPGAMPGPCGVLAAPDAPGVPGAVLGAAAGAFAEQDAASPAASTTAAAVAVSGMRGVGRFFRIRCLLASHT